jgi:predicted lipoprotein with Yx(FWY)xxD motif
MSRPRFFILVAGIAAVALALASCSSSGGSARGSTGGASPPTAAGVAAGGQAGAVDLATSRLGQIIVDSSGRTLYLFKADSGTTSNCSGACATAWPPLRATSADSAGSGVSASLLGTTPRSDGPAQVTYNGHPLYTYAGDQKAGDTNGEGLNAFGGGWFVLSPAGTQISPPASSGAPASSGGGNGY